MMNASIADKNRLLAHGSNAFGFDLWSRVATKEQGNLAISPGSLSIALAMAYGGANGETARQMKNAMHFGEDPEALMSSWGRLSRSLSNPANRIKLRIANRLFGEETYTFGQSYLERARAAFGAPLEPVDFKSAPDPSRLRINGWVEAETEKRITDLLPAGSIGPLTRLVLVNAIYFLGDWLHQFDVTHTTTEAFTTNATTKKHVPLMQQVSYVGFGQTATVKLLELPYKGNTCSLFVVLPHEVDGLASLEASLSVSTFDAWKRALSMQTVSVQLPRFEVNPPLLQLSSDFKAMGMPIAFARETADFTKIANPPDPTEHFWLGEVFHKAIVKTDEMGTEAVAASAVVMFGSAAPSPTTVEEFRADHPFLFFIVERDSGLILFPGPCDRTVSTTYP